MSCFDYTSKIVDIPNYPEPGVVFKDVTPLIADAEGFQSVVDDIAHHFKGQGITKIVGAEARGFLVGAPVAYAMGVGFVPARKPGKLPRETYQESYALEYGTDALEIHKDALTPQDKVLIVDDLVATGGTAVACARLIESAGAQVAGFAFLMELSFLNPLKVIKESYQQEVYTLVQVH